MTSKTLAAVLAATVACGAIAPAFAQDSAYQQSLRNYDDQRANYYERVAEYQERQEAYERDRANYIRTFVDNYNRTRLKCLGYIAPLDALANLAGHNTFAGDGRGERGRLTRGWRAGELGPRLRGDDSPCGRGGADRGL